MIGAWLLAIGWALAPAAAQPPPSFAAVWVVNAADRASGDVYGEARIVRQDDEAVRLTMIDYGTSWIGGRSRDAVRIMPWTFRFDSWEPRRGPATSSQPKARARWSGRDLVLGKLTARGNGDFVWVWSLSGDLTTLTQYDSASSWGQATRAVDTRASGLIFHRAAVASDPASPLGTPLDPIRSALPAVAEIVVRASPDLSSLVVSCPAFDCRIVIFHSGIQVGVRSLPRGEPATLSADDEVRIEPGT